MEDSLTNRYSANASANGYEFEYAAALLIYLENISEVINFGVEKKDDIYVELKNGEKIFAQAKSSLEPDSIADTHISEIIESLRTLSENNNEARKLISIFNYFRPFGDNDSFSHESIFDKKVFAQLTTKTQNKLKLKVEKLYSIDFDKLEFWFLRFEGVDKLNNLKTYLARKLLKVSNESVISVDSLIQAWMCLIMKNAGNKRLLIKSEQMAGILFSKVLEVENFETILKTLDLFETLPFEDVASLKSKYFNFVDVSSLNFLLYNKIKSSYYEFRNKNRCLFGKESMKRFVEEYSTNSEITKIMLPLFEEFDSKKQIELGLYMAKVFVGFSCIKANVLSRVSEVFGYEN